MIILGTGSAGAADALLERDDAVVAMLLLRESEESLRRPLLRSSGSSSRLSPESPVAIDEGERAVVCRLARRSVRAGAGESGMALSGGESGGGTEP